MLRQLASTMRMLLYHATHQQRCHNSQALLTQSHATPLHSSLTLVLRRRLHICRHLRLQDSIFLNEAKGTSAPGVTHSDAGLPVITVPQKLATKIERRGLRRERRMAEQRERKREIISRGLVISCKRQDYNHYMGQRYAPKSALLVTQAWRHSRRNGDWFIVKPVYHDVLPAFFDTKKQSFDEFGDDLSVEVKSSLKEMGVEKPTYIQEAAFDTIRRGLNVQLSAETGSGKTIAYAAPILSEMQADREADPEKWENPPSNSPRLLVLVPTRDLATQIFSVLKRLASKQTHPPAIVEWTGGIQVQRRLRWPTYDIVDIAVSTPGIVSKLLTNKIISMRRAAAIVVDEADTLFDDSFSHLTKRIISRTSIRTHVKPPDRKSMTTTPADGCQLIMVSATVPRSLAVILDELVTQEHYLKIVSRFTNHPLMSVRQTFYRLSQNDRLDRAFHLVKEELRAGRTMIVFTRRSETAFFLQKFFQDNGLWIPCLAGAMTAERREGVWDRYRDGGSQCLICTDIASRGLDTVFVDHVINFEFPFYISDYIHRAGRVGRVGSKSNERRGFGAVTSYVCKSREGTVACEIERAVRSKSAFEDVNANIMRNINRLHGIYAADAGFEPHRLADEVTGGPESLPSISVGRERARSAENKL